MVKSQAYVRSVLFGFSLFAFTAVPLAGLATQPADLAKYGPFVETGRQGMVVTAGEQASEAGVELLRKGGNAVDAAVSASFVISVIRPQSTGIGGGGFFLLYRAASKETVAIDFRERAPVRATRDMFLRDGKAAPELSRNGALAVAVPGLVAGLVEVQTRYGTMPLAAPECTPSVNTRTVRLPSRLPRKLVVSHN